MRMNRKPPSCPDSSLDDTQLDGALTFLHSGTKRVVIEDSASLYPRHLAALPVRCPNLREFTVSRCNYRDEFVPRSSGAIFRLQVPVLIPLVCYIIFLHGKSGCE